VGRYLDSVHLVHDRAKRLKLQAKLLVALTDGVQDDDGTYKVLGLSEPDFARYPGHEATLIRYVSGWLKQQRFVFAGCEDEAAAQIVSLARQALGLTPLRLDHVLQLEDMRDEGLQPNLSSALATEQPIAMPSQQPPQRRPALDTLARPDEDTAEEAVPLRPLAGKPRQRDGAATQLAMF
jgi:hypothetical protein